MGREEKERRISRRRGKRRVSRTRGKVRGEELDSFSLSLLDMETVVEGARNIRCAAADNGCTTSGKQTVNARAPGLSALVPRCYISPLHCISMLRRS